MKTFRATLTVAPSFVSQALNTTPSGIAGLCPQQVIITGQDGIRYYASGGNSGVGGGGKDIIIRNASTGVVAFNISLDVIQTQAEAAGIAPPGGFLSSNTITSGNLIISIPDTSYFVIIFGHGVGVDTDKAVVYYEIDGASSFTLRGGYAGKNDELTTQFSPPQGSAASCFCAGHLMTAGTLGAVNDTAFQFPILVGYFGETRSTITALPSINFILSNTPVTEFLSDNVWSPHELALSVAGFGANIFDVDATAASQSRGFFLPSTTGALFCQAFYRADLDEAVAMTANPSNSFLNTNAPNFPTGLISAQTIGIDTTDFPIFEGLPQFSGGIDIPFHENILDTTGEVVVYPFIDELDNFNGAAGLATENYYSNPTVYPELVNDPQGAQLLFFPKIYREDADRDKLGLRIVSFDPATEEMRIVDFGKGQMYDLGTDVDSDTLPNQVSFTWNRTTGAITALIKSEAIGERSIIVSEFGNFLAIQKCSPEVQFPIPDQLEFLGVDFSKDFSLNFRSPEGVQINYTATGLPDGLTISERGVVSGIIVAPAIEGQVFNVVITGSNTCDSIDAAFDFTVGTIVAGGPSFNFIHSGS